LVLVHPATTTAIVNTPVQLATGSPAGKQHRTKRLSRDDRRRPRTLTSLLRRDHPRPAIAERGRQLTHPGIRLDPVVVSRAPKLPLVELERVALPRPVRDDAVRLDPLRHHPQRGKVNDELRLRRRHRRTPPAAGHAPRTADASPGQPQTPHPTHQTRHRRSAPAQRASPGSSAAASPSSAAPASPARPVTAAAPTRPCGAQTTPPRSAGRWPPTGSPAVYATGRPTLRARARSGWSAATPASAPHGPQPAASPTVHSHATGATRPGLARDR